MKAPVPSESKPVYPVSKLSPIAASEKIIELLSQEYLGQHIGGLAGGVAAALAAVAIAPMHDRTRRWAERRFQKGLYRLRHALPPLVGGLGLAMLAGVNAVIANVPTSANTADLRLIGPSLGKMEIAGLGPDVPVPVIRVADRQTRVASGPVISGQAT